MVPEMTGRLTPVFDSALHIENIGGGETKSFFDDVAKVGTLDFQEALRESIKQDNLFSSVGGKDQADYLLSAMITEIDKPAFGLTFTVDFSVKYRLLRADRSLVWEEFVTSSHTEGPCGGCSNMIGASRLNLATEGAVRENFRLLLGELAGLDL